MRDPRAALRTGEVRSFACYYGSGRLARLADYDLAIVQATLYEPAEIAALVRSGHDVVAYVSLGETASPAPDSAWVLRDPTTGQKGSNALWETVYLDCRSEGWRQQVLEKEIPLLLDRGVSGLFLDTLDVQERYPETRPAVASLLLQIRSSFPEVLLVTNRGFSVLDAVLAVADAFAFESFSSYHNASGYTRWAGDDLAWTARTAAKLNRLRGPRPVLAIDYAAPSDSALRDYATARARRYGFIPFVSTRELDRLPPAP